MTIADRYIGRQVLSGTFFAILMLTLVLVLGNLFKEARTLLVEYGAPMWVLGDFAINVLPVSLIFTIPWAFLTSVLLVFGKLSSDNELNAFRVAGMSLQRIALPVVLLGAALSGLCLWLNLEVGPHAKRQLDDIVKNTLIKDPRTLLRAGTDQSGLRNVRVDAGSSNGEVFQNLHIFVMDDRAAGSTDSDQLYVHADRAETVLDREKQQIRLRLNNAYIDGRYGGGREFTLLSEELEWMVVDYSDATGGKVRSGSMTNAEIDAYLATLPETYPDQIKARFLARKTRRYTSSFACLAFAMVGVPLGIKARRRDTSTGLVLSIGIGAGYFLASSMLGGSVDHQWLLWLPNLVCLALGIVLFARARIR